MACSCLHRLDDVRLVHPLFFFYQLQRWTVREEMAGVFAKLPRGAWGTAVVATGSLVPLVMNQKQRQALAHCQVPCGIFDDKMRSEGRERERETG